VSSSHGSADPSRAIERLQVRVVGTVQGVGFRPFVFRLAERCRLAGWVRNDGDGVTIEVEGTHDSLLRFIECLPRDKPPAAWIYATDHRFLVATGHKDFRILPSEAADGPARTWLLPDLASCADCRRELSDPTDRRYRYPFLNCTNCGPRYTIIDGLPYDRPRTAMKGFPMCAACADEYHEAANRRFHAQPVACPACGPRAQLLDRSGATLAWDDAAVTGAVDRLRAGGIVAVKGLGGYHLMVDASDEAAVSELRRRKRRSHKSFAVMYPDLGSLGSHVEVPPFAVTLIESTQSPVLILPRTALGSEEIAPSVAPGSPYLGVFLPYTPLHQLLLDGVGRPLVATSGNFSDEPIQFRETSARGELAGLCDAFLEHDRPILRPVDDSVLQILTRPRARPQMLRRARGYSPLPVLAPRPLPPILALGGQMNVTLAVSRDREVILSQHLGDLETHEARSAYRRTLDDLLHLYGVRPHVVVRDLHPDYFTTSLAEELGLPTLVVQHHHAHLAACMLENLIETEALGLTWDGTGFGPDRTVWGGELLLGDAGDFRRVGSLVPFRLPGGERAVEEPWRTALSLLWESFGESWPRDLPPCRLEPEAPHETVVALARDGIRAPVTTSMGRLFDGVSALLGLCTRNTHQAQAAQMLEWAAWSHGADVDPLPMPVVEDGDLLRLDWRETVRALVAALRAGDDPARLAAAFHTAIVRAALDLVGRFPSVPVVMAGGVFCNRYLTEALLDGLESAGRAGHVHGQLPPTDGSLAAGQLWVAAHRLEP